MNKTEIQKMLEAAYANRKKAYQIKAPRLFISHINDTIWELKAQLEKAGA